MQIRNALSDMLTKLMPKARVEVFITDLSPDIIKQLCTNLERRSTQQQLSEVFDSINKAGKQKPALDSLFHALLPCFTSSMAGYSSVIVVWCRPVESFYRVIV